MRKPALLAVLVLVGAMSFLWWRSLSQGSDATDQLAQRGFAVTSGAAPGYVEDRACSLCHADLARSYQQVAMAKSFYRPSAAKAIEDFSSFPFFHQPSGRHYEIERSGDEYTFRRYLLDESGRKVHQFERRIDWILGSGNHSRTYLYRTPGGELYQLPLAWYGDTDSPPGEPAGHWGMAPGYDRPDHQGVTRRVRRECMFCHNAYPDVEAGSDAYNSPQTFPADLPEGLGCQRCHGPGAEHAREALAGARGERARASIINPSRLAPERSRDLCYSCHMQPTVILMGVRRFGRADYSFLPGESLSDYQLLVDVDIEGHERSERFEINHHPYRLEQSRCFIASGGELSCLTCHDPHRKVPAARRAEHFRQACLSCHQLDDCGLEKMTGTAVDSTDCVACHMPKRRAQDVVQAVITDHRIRLQPGGGELTAPAAETDPVIRGIELTRLHGQAAGADAELYRALSAVRAGMGGAAITALEAQIGERSPTSLTPYLDLARAQLVARRYTAAEAVLDRILAIDPDHRRASDWKALCRAALGEPLAAIDLLHRSVASEPGRPEGWFNLGRILFGLGRHVESIGAFERAIELRPNHAVSHHYLARSLEALGRTQAAENHRRRTLEIDPSFAGTQAGPRELSTRTDRTAKE